MSYLARFPDYLHVVAAAIVDRDGNVLIAQRPAHLHQGGLWEFPGGKVERGEGAAAALARELEEELGIAVTAARPLLRIPYRYPERSVLLDVWRVEGYTGTPHGREGQPVRWVRRTELAAYDFPAANRRIVTALGLPERYLITPEPGPRAQWPRFLAQLERCVRGGMRLVQLRAKSLAPADLEALAREAAALCRRNGARLLLNGEPAQAPACGADGVHLSGAALRACRERPLPAGLLVAASCHDDAELRQAERIEADFAVLSPVMPTASHPQAVHLGWERFGALCADTLPPVYALGGMTRNDVATAQRHGALGIAAIRGLWDDCVG